MLRPIGGLKRADLIVKRGIKRELLFRTAALDNAIDVQVAGTNENIVSRNNRTERIGASGAGVILQRIAYQCTVRLNCFRGVVHVSPVACRVAANILN